MTKKFKLSNINWKTIYTYRDWSFSKEEQLYFRNILATFIRGLSLGYFPSGHHIVHYCSWLQIKSVGTYFLSDWPGSVGGAQKARVWCLHPDSQNVRLGSFSR